MMDWSIYLLKVAAIQAIALLAYQLLLDKEPIGHLKRAYLLFSLLLAFVVPTVTIWESTLPDLSIAAEQVVETVSHMESVANFEYYNQSFSWSSWLWAVYLIGFATALITLFRQLHQISKNYRSSLQSTNRDGAIWVAIDRPIRIHSFGRFIFYQKGNLPSITIRQHELAHVRQWHTIDRIFIKIMRVVWWFNPVLFFYERAIRHNHELLADKAAVANGNISVASYLQTLLAELNPIDASPSIANHLPFQLTKKRFRMIMNKPTPSLLLGKSSLIIFCWVAVFIYFGHTVYGQSARYPKHPEIYEIIEADQTALENRLTVAEWKDLAFDEVWRGIPEERRYRIRYRIHDTDSNILFVEYRISSLLRYIESTEKRRPLPPSEEEFADWQNPEKWQLIVDDQVIDNDRLAELVDREDIYQTSFDYLPIYSSRYNDDRRPNGTAIITTAAFRAYKLARVREALAYFESFR